MTSSFALGRALVSRYAIGQKPNSGALILGLTLSLASLIAAFSVIGLLRVLLPEPILGPSAAASIGDLPTFALYASGVLIGPFVELWAQVIPIELFRRFGASSRACIIFSALTFGCAHYLNGGLLHGASTFASGLVFAYGYVLCRPFGWLPSCLAAYSAHASHNLILISVMVLFPQWA